MARVMDRQKLGEYLGRLIDANPGNIVNEEGYKGHLLGSHDKAEETGEMTTEHYPGLRDEIDWESVRVAGGLHDMAKIFGRQVFHELWGSAYVDEHGLQDGISDSERAVRYIAQAIRTHFVGSNQLDDEANVAERAEFEKIYGPVDPVLMVPHTWPEAIVAHSELSSREDMHYPERIDDIQYRFANVPSFRKLDPSLAEAIERGRPRLLEMCEKVERLRDGKLSEQEIVRSFAFTR